jgi:perosamine synthetase
MEIALSRPDITQQEIDAVVEVLKSERLSLGPKLNEFEKHFAAYCGSRHAVACANGTSGLHMLVKAMGIGPDCEVITTPFSFIASANCILFENATPVFADIDAETWNIDPDRIEAAVTERTAGIIAVDVFGQIADFERIAAIARRHNLRVIEDSCEALGSHYRGRPAGTLGEAGVFGFYPNKQMTTGEGGMIVTDDDHLADQARVLRNQGRVGGGWLAHEQLGYNFRLSDLQCALGIVQLSRVEAFVAARQRVAQQYLERIAPEPRLLTQRIVADCQMSWFVFVVALSEDYTQTDRDRILESLRNEGIGSSNYFVPIHLQPFYREQYGYGEGDFPVCESLAGRTIALPFHNRLTESEVDIVCRTLTSLL